MKFSPIHRKTLALKFGPIKWGNLHLVGLIFLLSYSIIIISRTNERT